MADIKMLHTKAEVVRQDVQVEEGVINAVVGSTNVLDRMGDSISQDGWDLTSYKSNPVILWGHNVKEERPPIGKALKVWLEGKQERSKKLMFQVKFDLQDTFAAEVFRKIKDGFINTVSVGFLPSEWEDIEPSNPWGGRRYTKQELLELSFVPVPANPEAVVALRSLGETDKRFEPIEEKDAFPIIEDEKLTDEEENKEVIEENNEETSEEEILLDTETPKDISTDTPIEDSSVEENQEISEKDATDEVVTPEDPKIDEPQADTAEKDEEIALDEEKETEAITEVTEEEKIEEKEDKSMKEDEITKSVIPYKDMGAAPESDGWDGPGEMAKCDMMGLKAICTWYDSENADNRGAYKLPHHQGGNGMMGHKAVWRGVAAAMAALLGARGGVQIPDADRKGVYNHLKKHYAQFDKPAPDFKMVEDQVLAGLTEEIQALVLDREEKHVVVLVKKVIKEQKEAKYTSEQIKKALSLLNLALSLYKKDSKEEVKK